MKKILLAIVVAASLTACGDSKLSPEEETALKSKIESHNAAAIATYRQDRATTETDNKIYTASQGWNEARTKKYIDSMLVELDKSYWSSYKIQRDTGLTLEKLQDYAAKHQIQQQDLSKFMDSVKPTPVVKKYYQ